MFWTNRKNPEKLLGQYLDPSKNWTVEDDKALREWSQSSDEARNTYDKRVIAHRLMLGLSEDAPSRVERDRMMKISIERSMGQETKAVSWFRIEALIPAGVAALALILVLPGVFQDDSATDMAPIAPGVGGYTSPGDSPVEYLGTRGAEVEDMKAAIGISGVSTRDISQEYEVLHQSAFLDDRMRFSYRCENPELGRLFLFGVQKDELIWYFPLPGAGEKESIEINCNAAGGRVQLDGDTQLNKRHQSGEVTVYGIFSKESITVEEMERALDGAPPSISRLRERLPLGDNEVIHEVRVKIAEGAKGSETDARP